MVQHALHPFNEAIFAMGLLIIYFNSCFISGERRKIVSGRDEMVVT